MEIGIFARTFTAPTLDGVLDGVVGHGLKHVHFNLACAGVESLPASIDNKLCRTLRKAFDDRDLVMVGVSATFNAIHPDLKKRRDEISGAKRLIERCGDLGTSLVSLCSGTRDPLDPWRKHPDNNLPQAWHDLVHTLEQLLPLAERHRVTLGIEPEHANVIDSPGKARQLLNELKSESLKIIIDGANLFDTQEELSNMERVLKEAFDQLGEDIVMAHAKDIPNDPERKQQAAGTGRLDWDTYFRLLHASGFDGPVVLHNLEPGEVGDAVAFVRAKAGLDAGC